MLDLCFCCGKSFLFLTFGLPHLWFKWKRVRLESCRQFIVACDFLQHFDDQTIHQNGSDCFRLLILLWYSLIRRRGDPFFDYFYLNWRLVLFNPDLAASPRSNLGDFFKSLLLEHWLLHNLRWGVLRLKVCVLLFFIVPVLLIFIFESV